MVWLRFSREGDDLIYRIPASLNSTVSDIRSYVGDKMALDFESLAELDVCLYNKDGELVGVLDPYESLGNQSFHESMADTSVFVLQSRGTSSLDSKTDKVNSVLASDSGVDNRNRGASFSYRAHQEKSGHRDDASSGGNGTLGNTAGVNRDDCWSAYVLKRCTLPTADALFCDPTAAVTDPHTSNFMPANSGVKLSSPEGRLFTAICCGNVKDAAMVICSPETLGVDVSRTMNGGWQPIHCAARRGLTCMLAVLSEAGAQITAVTKDFVTTLHLAAAYGHIDAVSAILESGINIDSCDSRGCTPLHYAAAFGHDRCCILLLDSGASVTVKDLCGKTPLDVARTHRWMTKREGLLSSDITKMEGSRTKSVVDLS